MSEPAATVPAVPDAQESDRRVLAEPGSVLVEKDGTWWSGRLVEWARWDSIGWRGYCRWTTKPGTTYLTWVPAARVRPR